MKVRILDSLADVAPSQWDALGGAQPFLSHAYLDAMHASGSASATTGWTPCYLSLWDGAELAAATPLYRKTHSMGEFVFDWTWAEAYARQGADYYPKLVVQVPFTPVTGPRLLARDPLARDRLIASLCDLARESGLSSLHVLFPTAEEAALLVDAGLLLRQGVQFHWRNEGWPDFDAFLGSLSRDKRKKIRQDRRHVAEAGVSLKRLSGKVLGVDDWRFFHACYSNTYALRGRQPYLNLDFFLRLAKKMPDQLLLVIAARDEQAIAASLCIYDDQRVYGRYWGALEDVSCLHFEACYYQPMEFCLERGLAVLEGGAQGEHKLARGLLPVTTVSAHWLANPHFHASVARFLAQEQRGVARYREELSEHSPFKSGS